LDGGRRNDCHAARSGLTPRRAVADEHFVKRGLFSETVSSFAGEKFLPALPVPIAQEFRVTGTRSYPRID
jgi:hypothetical protein